MKFEKVHFTAKLFKQHDSLGLIVPMNIRKLAEKQITNGKIVGVSLDLTLEQPKVKKNEQARLLD